MADAMHRTHSQNCAQVGAVANTHLACTHISASCSEARNHPDYNLQTRGMNQDRAKTTLVNHIAVRSAAKNTAAMSKRRNRADVAPVLLLPPTRKQTG
jgi:hypothetical protein